MTPLALPSATLSTDQGDHLTLAWKPRAINLPRLRSHPADANWLKVHAQVTCPRGTWSFTDPCLTELEAADLADWLAQRPWPVESTLAFTEPCLTLTARGTRDSTLLLFIRFRAEAAPPWLHDDPEALWHTGHTIDFTLREHQLQSFTRGLQCLLGVK